MSYIPGLFSLVWFLLSFGYPLNFGYLFSLLTLGFLSTSKLTTLAGEPVQTVKFDLVKLEAMLALFKHSGFCVDMMTEPLTPCTIDLPLFLSETYPNPGLS